MKATIAVAQMDSTGNRSENLRKMEDMTKRAAAEGADLILFPEHADFLGKPIGLHAEADHGKLAQALGRMAAENRIWLHSGSIPEMNPEGKPYNTSLFFDRDGNLAAKYRKIHLFEVDISNGPRVNESDVIEAGDKAVVVDTEFGRVGFAICYDLRFPELFHKLADQGAELISCLPILPPLRAQPIGKCWSGQEPSKIPVISRQRDRSGENRILNPTVTP